MLEVSKYVEFYYKQLEDRSISYSEVASRILLDNPDVGYSHRTLRKMVSESFKESPNTALREAAERWKVSIADGAQILGNTVSVYPRDNEEGYVEQGCGWVTHNPNVEDGPRPYDWTTRSTGNIPELKKRVRIISDLHGVYLDKVAFNVFLQTLKEDRPDGLVINGDLGDFPFLSRHHQKLIKAGVLQDYSEIGEIEYIKSEILCPICKVYSGEIIVRLGNHDERITNPYDLTQAQLKRLAVVYNHYNTTKYEEMLGLKSMNILYDPTPVRNYYGIFDVMHGLSLAKNAQERNILDRMTSGTTGHSHRLGVKYITKAGKHYAWIESGHMRRQDEVEYFPTAVLPDWQQGFVDVTFDLSSAPKFFAKPVAIVDGVCELNGKIYR